MERTQILLEPDQRKELDRIARNENISRSKLLRKLIEEGLRERKSRQLEAAARELLQDYENDPALTDLNVLDSEDFHA